MKRLARALFVLAIMGMAVPALSQIPAPPVRQAIDANGIDLIHQTFNTSMTDVSIGPAGGHGLSYTRYWQGGGWWDSLVATISGSTSNPIVSIGASSDSFSSLGGGYVSDQGNGATLALVSGNYLYTSANGTTAQFAPTYTYSSYGSTYEKFPGNVGLVRYVQFPDGTRWTYTYRGQTYCIYDSADMHDLGYTLTNCPKANAIRLQSVTNSFGYQLKITYSANTLTSIDQLDAWNLRTSVTAINNAIEACTPSADACSLTHAWPTASYGYNSGGALTSVTDPAGRVWQYAYAGGMSIRRPGASVDDVTFVYSPMSVNRQGVTTTYSFSTSGATQTATITDPAAHTRTVVADLNLDFITSSSVQTSASTSTTTTYTADSVGRTSRVTQQEGNYTDYEYDYGVAGGRGNVTKMTQVAKGGSGLANIVTSANYPSTCGNPFTCNQPTDSTDERGNVTTYAYDGASGLPTSVTLPAPGGDVTAQPTISTSYMTITSAFDNVVLTLPNTVSVCRTATTCPGSSNESKRVTSYYTSSQNYLPHSTTIGAGDGSLTVTTSQGYDLTGIGNVTQTTDGLGNITAYGYDAARQNIWILTPDPDGPGPLKNRMQLFSYNADGTILTVQQGTANADSTGFSMLQYVSYGYDAYGRRKSETLVGGSTIYAQTAYSYDGLGRVGCTAQRMNMASLPFDACTAGTVGTDGPDRISAQEYDWAGRPWRTAEGFASATPRFTVINSYTDNGKLATLTDANGNVTSYTYDGFDRPYRTCYSTPLATCSATPSNYEQIAYSNTADGTFARAISRRLRDGNSLAFLYDNLGRVTRKTPQGTNLTGNDVPLTYTYDNLNDVLTAVDTVNGHNVTLTYDALGRVTAEYGPWRVKQMTYDLNGRTKVLNYGDAWVSKPDFYITYTYDNVGAMTGLWENGSTLLASYSYDDLGRRLSIFNRPNGVVTNYTYDGASRLTVLANDLAGVSNDLSINLTYNSAGQITQRTSTNDAYSWSESTIASRSYAVNGLNQYTSISSTPTITPTYDMRGNLFNAGGNNYAYTAMNQLQAVSTGSWFYYDAEGRLDIDSGVSSCALLDNVGSLIDAELDCSTGATARRYVYGADNAPLVWYEGAGLTDKRWLITDERGSVVAVTDGSGNAMRINTYDEYGIPGTNNLGRFGYTGQAWLPSIGMYYDRARVYSPTLGRFVQTDPTGYGDGPNWYNYVHGDPINGVDPSGLAQQEDHGYEWPVLAGEANVISYDANDPPITVTGKRPLVVSPPWITYGAPDTHGRPETATPDPVDPPCATGQNCKSLTLDCNISNNFCGPKPKPVQKPKPAPPSQLSPIDWKHVRFCLGAGAGFAAGAILAPETGGGTIAAALAGLAAVQTCADS